MHMLNGRERESLPIPDLGIMRFSSKIWGFLDNCVGSSLFNVYVLLLWIMMHAVIVYWWISTSADVSFDASSVALRWLYVGRGVALW